MTEIRASSELNHTVATQLNLAANAKRGAWWRGLSITGPGILVAVGYIDPGNWATDIAGGSYAGYLLLSVVLLSSLIAMLLQVMSARLGIATGKDLAESSCEAWPTSIWPAWIAAELAIIATDLAEVIGSAIALKLLFGIPMVMGVVMAGLDVLLILALDKRGSQLLERMIAFFLFIIACGLFYELALSQPVLSEVLPGFIPSQRLFLDSQLLYLAIGVIGATVMPHNLYLHSHLVIKHHGHEDKSRAIGCATLNTVVSLGGALLLNAALVILAASTFHSAGHTHITELSDAHHLLTPLLGTGLSAVVFAIMLLAAGQSASITGTLAGQVVMTGYMKLRSRSWVHRLLTRLTALVPAVFILVFCGEHSATSLLVGSQVFLSLQLPLAMISLLLLTSDVKRMGQFVNGFWLRCLGWASVLVITLANAVLIISFL